MTTITTARVRQALALPQGRSPRQRPGPDYLLARAAGRQVVHAVWVGAFGNATLCGIERTRFAERLHRAPRMVVLGEPRSRAQVTCQRCRRVLAGYLVRP